MNVKITKLPETINPNKILREKMAERYSVCPFCGETEKCKNPYDIWKSRSGIHQNMPKSWHGKRNEDNMFSVFKFWERSRYWKIDQYKCYTCGAEWESEPYPYIDIKEII